MIKPNKSLSITQTKADTFWFYSSRRRRNYAFWKGWVWHWFQDTPSLLNYLYKDPQRNIYGGFRKKFLKILAHMTLIWWIIIDDDDDDGCGGVSGSSMTDPSLKHFPSAPPYILNSHLHWAAAVQCACALYTVHCTVYTVQCTVYTVHTTCHEGDWIAWYCKASQLVIRLHHSAAILAMQFFESGCCMHCIILDWCELHCTA